MYANGDSIHTHIEKTATLRGAYARTPANSFLTLAAVKCRLIVLTIWAIQEIDQKTLAAQEM